MALDRDIALLAEIPILSLFDRDALRLLAFTAETRILSAGDVLFRKGETSDGAYLVVSGSVAMDGRDDGSPAPLLRPGALIGELAMFADTTRPATALAREATTVLKLTRKAMHRVLEESPETAQKVGQAIARRVGELSAELAVVRRTLLAIDE